MPALEVSVDGVTIATVNMDSLDVVSVNVGGTQVDDELASQIVSGGNYPEGGPPTSLTWVDDTPLRAGQPTMPFGAALIASLNRPRPIA